MHHYFHVNSQLAPHPGADCSWWRNSFIRGWCHQPTDWQRTGRRQTQMQPRIAQGKIASKYALKCLPNPQRKRASRMPTHDRDKLTVHRHWLTNERPPSDEEASSSFPLSRRLSSNLYTCNPPMHKMRIERSSPNQTKFPKCPRTRKTE